MKGLGQHEPEERQAARAGASGDSEPAERAAPDGVCDGRQSRSLDERDSRHSAAGAATVACGVGADFTRSTISESGVIAPSSINAVARS